MTNYFFKKTTKINIAIFSLIAMFFLADMTLKSVAIKIRSVNILGNFFKFNFVANKNIAFSLPLGGKLLTVIISGILFLILCHLFFLFLKNRFKEFFGFLAVFLGALSNFIDRLKYSFVVDYLDLSYFAVFNLADVLIFCGVVFLIYFYFVSNKQKVGV